MTEATIFAAALERKTPGDRQAYLDQACADNPELRASIEELLKADADAGSFLEHAPVGLDATVASDSSSCDTAGAGAWAAHLSFLQPCDKPHRLGQFDDYEIIEVVGHGGMGAVLRAFDTKLSRVVAVKIMSPTLAANPIAVKRFLREATTAASIHHDHIVTIHAVNDSHIPPYLVMQFIEGQTLQQKIDREGPLKLEQILRIGSQAAAGLAAAHKLGLIHRDVKPANILLENGVERVKIADFGLARAADEVQMTQTGIIAGTPQYMSPEQAKGEPIDTRSDLFSLGSVLYTMCTGRPAFRADNPVAVLKRVCDDTPRPIHDINPDIPSWLEAIVGRLLDKDPADRFQSATQLAELLSQHLAHEQNPALAPLPAPVSQRTTQLRRPGTSARRATAFVSAAAILIFVSLAVSEAAGVTHLATTVIRIATGEGTLVIEADDPNVKVAINGEEVTIHGTGVEEVHLRPGSYKLAASKDGQAAAVDRDLVTITRGGKQVVRVAVEGTKAKEGQPAIAGWQPPENPDPMAILYEAEADQRAKRYDAALAKYLWMHDKSLQYGPSFVGVRLSSALMGWKELGNAYPPALAKLKETRDKAEANVKAGMRVLDSFLDLTAINENLGDERNTTDVVKWLDGNRPDDAKTAVSASFALPALVKTKEFRLAGKYLDHEQAYAQAVAIFKSMGGMSKSKKPAGESLRLAESKFTSDVATIVALLVIDGREVEANKIARQAKQDWHSPALESAIDRALGGEVPAPLSLTELMR